MSKSKSNAKPTLGVTPGEPAGIGPDICVESYGRANKIADLIYFADPDLLEESAARLGLDITINNLEHSGYQDESLNVHPVVLCTRVEPGRPNPANAQYVLNSLDQALKSCQTNNIDALVTGPVNKSIINEAGHPFSGHTEWLAQQTNTAHVVMMLLAGNLRVALATTHIPLSQVSGAITQSLLRETILILESDLRTKFSINRPRILVCGLNPHAGEGGYLGREEIDVITPVIRQMADQGMAIKGPIPADTAFTARFLAESDAVLAMYHDQGLPVLKHAAFGEAVNVTLGLSIIRTSVDHGTAFDLAGTGAADSSSLIAAIKCATDLVNHQSL